MQTLRIFDRKDKKRFLELLKEQFGFEEGLDYIFLMNNKNKVFIINKDIANIDLSKIKVNIIGLYIAEWTDNRIRLSIEGSQLIGPKAKKNILELNEKEVREWLKGNNLDKEIKGEGFVIIKHNQDYLGSGKVTKLGILNFVSKTRRLNI